MKNIKRYFLVSLLSLTSVSSLVLAGPVPDVSAANCNRVFTFPTWYKGVTKGAKCEVEINHLNDFWTIVLNFIEILLQAVAYVSASFIVWGGFKYIKSEGDPGKISESKAAIINAVIGLVIALASVAIVEYVQGRIIP